MELSLSGEKLKTLRVKEITMEQARDIILKIATHTDVNSEEYSAYAVALEAIERQIPVKPKRDGHTHIYCGNCGKRIRSGEGSSSRIRDTVCRYCFQVVDWSDGKN